MENADVFLEYFSDSSDEENHFAEQILIYAYGTTNSITRRSRGGSQPGKRPNIDRRAEEGAIRLFKDYFSETPIYTDEQFRRRYRMHRRLFLKIKTKIETNEYFIQKPDATGKLGLTCIQKCTAAIRQLAYGSPSDAMDEYVRIGESTARKCLMEFCRTVDTIFSDEFLRSPTRSDLKRLLKVGNERGFPGMLGSLDCCHWQWKNCPTAWAGQYKGKEKKPTIVLEVVASYDLWIWHAFFGMPGSNNDITVLHRSPLFSNLYGGKTPSVKYEVNGHTYNTGYYLADGIYPPLATLVQTIASPVGQKRKYFAERQESTRKDVERAFGVLMARFAIIKNPARLWNKEDLKSIMRTCIILHNMIIEDEREDLTSYDIEESNVHEVVRPVDDFTAFLGRYREVHNTSLHHQLQNDLIEHLWNMKGDEE
ncbi:uncharacterized protein LOC131693340 [Topomyia yanbarensis]|uniref:uncharacterized protein LOC131681862 n=1 Tax=Topomyia yanbarensis TaxID=2498891 RepID=UPI00273C02DA|nr:uncharacterized protein LOC131681862 [Topomyia yanbarensis]XP_058818911.1 uncharacterized protein LOC131681862 [Topomyia yanbarensis]XP_058831403.1 uncharacterized protein LOC131689990 [Topomyia yanbarensis]XP_058832074.1 uncharacterized protein LOC131690375 [Topomyia yanbarensis]XP_058837056.1 uncharacterized protein LOC131693340 [Topomyia yanbarensis]